MQVPNIQREDLGGRIAIALAAVCLTSFLYKMIKVRLRFYRLRRQGMPMPPWDPIFGNLRLMPGLARKCPSDALQSQSFALLSMEHPGLQNGFYIDLWPFMCPMFVTTTPPLAVQACQTYNLPKPTDLLAPFINPMTGGDNFFTTNGAEWKHDRDLFNHAFSMTATLGHVDYILEEAEVYVGILRELAQSGDTFSMDQLACNYMMDVIVTDRPDRNTRFNYQTGHNPIAASMRDTIDLECGRQGENNPFRRWNFYRLYRQWRNSRTMDRYIGLELEKRYQEWLQHDQTTTRGKSIMDIVIAEYMKTRPTSQTYNSTLDPEFKSWAVIQIRLFLFVGHDSTAVTIIYCLYLLSKHPETLAKIRLEHEQIFGSKTSVAPQIKQHPEMINQMPYTHAVIKETLRLFPPANGLRFGRPGVSLTDTHSPDGRTFPVDRCAVWIVHTAIQRNTGYWPYPHNFIPDRWLVQPGHELYPPTGGWRPFERGARDCVGQNMAFLGIKITLAMVVREFDFDSQYEEWDRENPETGAVRAMFGERAYLVAKGAAHPAQGYPCKVRLVA